MVKVIAKRNITAPTKQWIKYSPTCFIRDCKIASPNIKGMTLAEIVGVHHMLVAEASNSNGFIEGTVCDIAALIGVKPKSVEAVLGAMWKIIDGVWHNERMDKIRDDFLIESERRIVVAHKGAEARWGNAKKEANAPETKPKSTTVKNASSISEHAQRCSTMLDIDLDLDKDLLVDVSSNPNKLDGARREKRQRTKTATPKAKPKSKPKAPMSVDWSPSAVDHDIAKSLGLSGADVERIAPEFRTYWLASGEARPGWTQTWRMWIKREAAKHRGAAALKQTRAKRQWGA